MISKTVVSARKPDVRALFPCAALALFMAAIPSARAEDIPSLDIQRACQGITSRAMGSEENGGRRRLFDQCVSSEKLSRYELASRWSNSSVAQRAECIQETNLVETPTYTDLLVCLEIAEDAITLGFSTQPSIEH
jgi:hypothetical protein